MSEEAPDLIWTELPQSGRTWAHVPNGPVWQYKMNGSIAAISRVGKLFDLSPNAEKKKIADRAVALYTNALRDIGASEAEQASLLALMSHECDSLDLPCPERVPPGTTPRSFGLYQFTEEGLKASGTGITMAEIKTNLAKNHEAALALLRRLVPETGDDFPSLALLWNAGGVKADPENEWGVVAGKKSIDHGTALTAFVKAYNAVRPSLDVALGKRHEKDKNSGALAATFLFVVLTMVPIGLNAAKKTRTKITGSHSLGRKPSW